jgi:hypothetical protein
MSNHKRAACSNCMDITKFWYPQSKPLIGPFSSRIRTDRRTIRSVTLPLATHALRTLLSNLLEITHLLPFRNSLVVFFDSATSLMSIRLCALPFGHRPIDKKHGGVLASSHSTENNLPTLNSTANSSSINPLASDLPSSSPVRR